MAIKQIGREASTVTQLATKAVRRTTEQQISVDDFVAYMPTHNYIFKPTREMWPAAAINARLGPTNGERGDAMKASEWLDKNSAVEQMSWTPGEPMLIRNRLVADGGWIEREGVTCFNLYRPPIIASGDASKAEPWIELVRKVFPDEAEHIINWLAHRIQRPHEKLNHALVLGGAQGIGKDTILEPVKDAVGPWNVAEVNPEQLVGRFNSFVKSVILRVSEAHDLGDLDRYKFYERCKTLIASPPDVLRCDEKNLREHSVPNLTGVVILTNHKTDGIFLPPDDRRHFVAWSDRERTDFTPEYWSDLYRWYNTEGRRHVAAYLRSIDISSFNPKAPPPQTPAFWEIVDASRPTEDGELSDLLETMGNPAAFTLEMLIRESVDSEIHEWIKDRKNRRVIGFRLEKSGYVSIRNDAAQNGLWTISGKRQAVYARRDLPVRERHAAAQKLTNATTERSWSSQNRLGLSRLSY
jgi:hypothetical protein